MIKNRRKVKVSQCIWVPIAFPELNDGYKPRPYFVREIVDNMVFLDLKGTKFSIALHEQDISKWLNRSSKVGGIAIFNTYRKCMAECKRWFTIMEDGFKEMKWVEVKND